MKEEDEGRRVRGESERGNRGGEGRGGERGERRLERRGQQLLVHERIRERRHEREDAEPRNAASSLSIGPRGFREALLDCLARTSCDNARGELDVQ